MSWSSDFPSIILRGRDLFFFKCLKKVSRRIYTVPNTWGRVFCKYFYTLYIAKADVGRIFFSIRQQIKVNGVTLDEYILPYHLIKLIHKN